MDVKIRPTYEGLLRCLQALAEESASLGLACTHLALRQAIDACLVEGGTTIAGPAIPPRAELLH